MFCTKIKTKSLYIIRYLDRNTKRTSNLAGVCQQPAIETPVNASPVNGAGEDARFRTPYKIINDARRPNTVFVTEREGTFIREVNIESRVVSNYFDFSTIGPDYDTRAQLGAIVQDPSSYDLYVTSMNFQGRYSGKDSILRVDYDTKSVTDVGDVDATSENGTLRLRVNDFILRGNGRQQQLTYLRHSNTGLIKFSNIKSLKDNVFTKCDFDMNARQLRQVLEYSLSVLIDGDVMWLGYPLSGYPRSIRKYADWETRLSQAAVAGSIEPGSVARDCVN